jgi:hypothetical protein
MRAGLKEKWGEELTSEGIIDSWIVEVEALERGSRDGEHKLRYLRFGDIPKSGVSLNHLTGENERGVSVYEAVQRDGAVFVLLPIMPEFACVSLWHVIRRPAYWVDGEVVGRGADGEILLSDIRVIARAKDSSA